MVKFLRLLTGMFLVVNLATACATHRTTSETVQYEGRSSDEPATVDRRTTTTTETSGSEDSGVLSGTVNVIGEIIALPFRAVGGLVRAIF